MACVGLVQQALYLPPFGTNAFAGHGFTPMPRWVETGKPLFQGMWHIDYRRDNHLSALHRNAHPLVDLQMCLTGDSRGYADTQVVTPLLDVQDGLGHDSLQ
jgi:hypothetical protein